MLLARILKERRRRWEEAELARMKKAGKPQRRRMEGQKYKNPKPPTPAKLPSAAGGWCWASVRATGWSPRVNGKCSPDGMGLPSYGRICALNGSKADSEDGIGQCGKR